MITVGSLFAGIGGLEKGLEDTGGFVTKWQVECDEYANRVLTKHWPDVRRWNDVRTFPPMRSSPVGPVWQKREWEVDLICGGFPCQDISNAGKRAGIKGTRSGLFYEVIRVARLLRPRFLLLENVAALLHRGMGTVLGELSQIGYDAEWHCIPAASVGAPHFRDRVFIVARRTRQDGMGDPDNLHRWGSQREVGEEAGEPLPSAGSEDVADAEEPNDWGRFGATIARQRAESGEGRLANRGPWAVEPDVGRVADGVSKRVDRLRCLGNAVVPQVAELIGHAILATEAIAPTPTP